MCLTLSFARFSCTQCGGRSNLKQSRSGRGIRMCWQPTPRGGAPPNTKHEGEQTQHQQTKKSDGLGNGIGSASWMWLA